MKKYLYISMLCIAIGGQLVGSLDAGNEGLETILANDFAAQEAEVNRMKMDPRMAGPKHKKDSSGSSSSGHHKKKDCCKKVANCCSKGLKSPCGKIISIGQKDLPFVADVPGTRYCLKEDVTWDGSDAAITIATHDVELDLNLHTITLTQLFDPNTGTPAGVGISVVSDSSNILIKDGNIIGNTPIVPPIAPGIPAVPGQFSIIYSPNQNGIVIDSSDRVTVSNVTTKELNIGVLVFTSNDLTIEKSLFQHCIWGIGLSSLDSGLGFFVRTHDLKITDCTIIDHAEFGIRYGYGSNTFTIMRNLVVQNNQSDGIFFSGGGSDLLFENVDASFNQNNGIHTQLYTNNIIFNNCQFRSNRANGLQIIGTRNCVLNECQAVSNGLSGIAFLTRASDTVELNNCKVVNSGGTGVGDSNGGEIPLRFDMVRNLLINGCQVWSYGQPTIPGCDPEFPEICSQNNFPAVRIQQCNNVKMVDTLITLGFTDPTNPGNGLLIKSSEGLQIENVNTDFGFLGGLEPTPSQANAFLVQGGVKNCVFRNCQAQGFPNNGFAVIWENDEEADPSPIFNGFSGSIVFEFCTAVGARNAGFYIDLPSNQGVDLDAVDLGGVTLLNNIASHNFRGIQLTDGTINCAIRDNTLLSNDDYGLLDENAASPDTDNAIYHNFAKDNGTNYSANVRFVVPASVGLGVLENIDDN